MNLRLATLQRLALLAVILLAVAYLAILRPLAQRVLSEEIPMRDMLNELNQATLQAGLPRGTDFESLAKQLAAMRAALTEFSNAQAEALPRLEHPPEVRSRLQEPFQLFEFLNESQRRVEELTALAQARKVTLTPGMARGFPRYQAELARPELLWVQLATVNRLVQSAIHAGAKEIQEVSVEPLPTVDSTLATAPQLPPPPPERSPWSILRVHMTLVGDVDALGQFLLALTLTPDELEAAGLPSELAGRPVLFIESLLMRRNSLEAPEQVQLEVVISTAAPDGF